MPAYYYTAIDSNGKEKKGVIEAENKTDARRLLRERSLLPIDVKATTREKKTEKESRGFSFLQRKLSSKEVALITRQIATLLPAGLPIEQALQAVGEQTEKARTKGVIFSVRSQVMAGHTLAAAMRTHPEAFSPLYTATIAAGEKSGHLDKVLLRLADYTEAQWNMKQKLRSALIYPCMIVLVSIAIVGFLLEYVVPKMVSVYANIKQKLPIMTTILIAASDFFKSYGLYLFLGIFLLIFLFMRSLKKNIQFREAFHRLLLRLPLIGHFMKTADTARFMRTLSILGAAGIPILDAMTVSGNLITTIPIRKAVAEAVDRVREGASINLALKQTNYFTPMSIHMIASGEASGQVESMLERVARNQEDEISRLIEVSLALFEPAVILLMGAIVLFIVLAVLLPIFQLDQFTG